MVDSLYITTTKMFRPCGTLISAKMVSHDAQLQEGIQISPKLKIKFTL